MFKVGFIVGGSCGEHQGWFLTTLVTNLYVKEICSCILDDMPCWQHVVARVMAICKRPGDSEIPSAGMVPMCRAAQKQRLKLLAF